MKLTVSVVIIFGILALTQAEQIPAFARSLENLIRECPLKTAGIARSLNTRSSNVQTKNIFQKLDHFNEKEKRSWLMRYMVNDVHFKPGGPIFIYLGGEWAIEPETLQYGILADLAQEHNAIMFYTEHRYYGTSKPTWDLSFDSMQHLNVKQSLADLAHFIRTQRKTDPRLAKSKVIISGCSYSATMAVWFSRLYPDLVDGTWASSAPLLAQVDFKEYTEVVGRALYQLGSPQCYNRIQNGIAILKGMLTGNRADKVKAMLNLCNNFDHNNNLDFSSLFCSISNIFKGVVQYQYEGQVADLCNNIMSSKDDLTAISNLFIDNLSDRQHCIDATYNGTVNHFRNTLSGNFRPWLYQSCNEFGWFLSSNSHNQPFGSSFPVEFFIFMCRDIFNAKYTKEHITQLVAETNKLFGGKYPNVQNVYMTNGGLDPWGVLGQSTSQSATVIANVLPGASHCADLGSITSYDNSIVRDSKVILAKLLRTWLGK